MFTHREGINTPNVCHKGRQPLIECVKHDFKIMYFPFFIFFFIFLGSTRGCPCSYVSSSAMRNSDLGSSLKWESLCVELVLCCWKIHFKLTRTKRIVKELDLERSKVTLMERNSVMHSFLSWVCVLTFNLFKRQLYGANDWLRFYKKHEITDDRWRRWICTK